MLISFSVKNFASIKEKITLQFAHMGKEEQSGLYFREHDLNFSKAVLIAGGNGSGKTNILKALRFLIGFISFSFYNKQPQLPYQTYFDDKSQLTELEIEFVFEKHRYRYILHCSPTTVFYEALFIKKSSFNFIFKRTWDPQTEAYTISKKNHSDPVIQFTWPREAKLRNNASLISTAVQFNQDFSVRLKAYFEKYQGNVDFLGKVDFDLADVSKFYFENKDIKEQMSQLLSQLDLGLSAIDVVKLNTPPTEKQEVYIPYGTHIVAGKSFNLGLAVESGGTRKLYTLCSAILPALIQGSVVIIDELDAELHPMMVEKIVQLFLSERSNPHHAQLIFISHCLQPLNMLDKEQIVLVEKDETLNTSAWHLSDTEDVRNDQNFLKKYLSGTYGAVPHIGLI